MAVADVTLSLLAFPQRCEAGVLHARVLLLPAGDPTQPSAGLPAFRAADWALRAAVLPGLDALIGASSSAAQTLAFTAPAPASSVALFDALDAHFRPAPPRDRATRAAGLGGLRIRKFLPDSYRNAFPFDRPGADTTDGNEFACALRDTVPMLPTDPKPPSSLTWGAVLSFALRQPRVARALGLIHDFAVPLNPSDLLENGGWLYVELDPAAGLAPLPGAVRSYAARLPPLAADARRALLGAVLIPTGLSAAGDYGDALLEAATYDDGFCKIVHVAQAITADATSSGHNMLPPGTDAGLDIGWDDEQVTAWLNRQIDGLRERLAAAPTPGAKFVEAPLGVSGYRIDVRQIDPAPDEAEGEWESLCRAFSANAEGDPAPLTFPPPPAAPVFSERFDGELSVEPVPARSIHSANATAWLPQHFARWQSGSLVVNDITLFQLTGTSPRDANGAPIHVGAPTFRSPRPAVRLRYGREYELRCRLVDLTGGGPEVARGDEPINPALQSSAKVRFRRHVPPKTLRLDSHIELPEPGQPMPDVSRLTTLDVRRPLIAYPEMMFAGIEDPQVIADLVAQAAAARAEGRAVGVNDADVTHVHISVQVRAPANDAGPPGLRDGAFREVYSTELALPPYDADDVLSDGAPLTLTFDYHDVADVAPMAGPAPGSATLPIPTARDVRLRLTAVCADKPHYFGSSAVRSGLASYVATRSDAEDELDLVSPLPPGQTPLAAILLQPGPALAPRLADRLRLAGDVLKLAGRPGERVIFSASGSLRHTLSPERDAITFASEGELLGRWLTVLQIEVGRDWTWDGIEDYGFEISRSDGAADAWRVIGNMPIPSTVSTLATSGADRPGEDRRARTRLIFLDSVDPNPSAGAFPRKPFVRWRITPRLRGFTQQQNEAMAGTHEIDLPIAVAPRQMPKVVAAGIALSPFVADEHYASTQPRAKVLWFEFEQPIEDPNDGLYARVLAYGPDPLLSGDITHRLVPAPDLPYGPTTWFDALVRSMPHPPAPPELAIDPEPMRVILPGQSEDRSALDAMVEMNEAFPVPGETRSRYFTVPLPPGLDPDAPELFGFWTYEIRVGHKALWSTAQARFGRPLVVQGVQHPPPTLRCTAFRVSPEKRIIDSHFEPRIVVTAPHATPVFEGRALTNPSHGDPRTRIWALLYAQVVQADGATRRNVLIARAPALPQIQRREERSPMTRDITGMAEFSQGEIERRLRELALPVDASLSVIAVELLPGGHLQQVSSPQQAVVHITERAVERVPYEVFFTIDIPEFPAEASADTQATTFATGRGVVSDPLGAELGGMNSRRILRCSPLTPVAPAC